MTLLRLPLKVILILSLFGLFITSCQKDEKITPQEAAAYGNDVFFKWNELYLELDRYASGYRPGPTARSIGLLGYSAYECTVAGMPEFNSLKNRYPGLSIPAAVANQDYYWPAAVNESYAFLMARLFYHVESSNPDIFHKIEITRNELRADYVNQTDLVILERSEKLGQDIARGVYDWAKTDAFGHDAFLDPRPATYTPPVFPGAWAPTFPDNGRAMFPYWGSVRTFAMPQTELVGRPPIPYSEVEGSPYWTQALEVYNRVNNINQNGPNAYEDKWVAEFWSDDIGELTFSPPARLVAIANQMIQREDLNLAECAELYAKLGLAINDSGVAIWKSKYFYNIERPVSYIRTVLATKYPDAANWKSALNNPLNGTLGLTPSFPAYPSGHSGFGGCGGKILSAIFEFNSKHPGTYTFIDNCHANRTEFIGTPRTMPSFKDMANENAYSRIPLGVHFRMDCDEGLRLGELAAQRVLELPWKK